MDRNPGAFVAPSLDEPMHAVVGAVISAPTQFLKQPLGRAAFALRQLGFIIQNLSQNPDPIAEPGRGLHPALVKRFADGAMRSPGTPLPRCAEFIFGRRFGPTRWLHAGYRSLRRPGLVKTRVKALTKPGPNISAFT
jgi:hypothetical protein